MINSIANHVMRYMMEPRAVDPAGQADVAAALRQLRGMRAGVLGSEEAVTHLLIGAPRRTLKVPPCFQAP